MSDKKTSSEPVARHPDAIIEGVMTSVGITHAIYASTVSLKHGEQVKLYAEQPAPVAVVLPTKHDFEQFIIHRDGAVWVSVLGDRRDYNEPINRDYAMWLACLDEVTRLNIGKD